jgi:hypothetical protein
MLPAMSDPITYKMQLVQRDGTITAGAYTSPNGDLPNIGDEIPADDHGHLARVTSLSPGEMVPIYAELID